MLISGVAWTLIAWLMAFVNGGRYPTLRELPSLLVPGIIVGPAIGLLIGVMARNFIRYDVGVRAFSALGSLYLAAFLFNCAYGVQRLLLSPGPITRDRVFEDVFFLPLIGWTLWGLTGTGLVAVLWPLAYINHVLVSKRWMRAHANPDSFSLVP